MSVIELYILGSIDLRERGGPQFKSLVTQPKRIALLLYLCLEKPYGLHRRDTLVALFWPDADQSHARTSLRNSLHALRQALGANALQTRGEEDIGVNRDIIWSDAIAFEECVRSGHVEDALELYAGDLLPGFFVEGAPDFDRWLDNQRKTLRHLAAKAARISAERREAENRITDAISCAQRAVQLSNSDERVVRRLIELLTRAGDKAAALKAYENFARYLAAEFNAVPSPETDALVEGWYA